MDVDVGCGAVRWKRVPSAYCCTVHATLWAGDQAPDSRLPGRAPPPSPGFSPTRTLRCRLRPATQRRAAIGAVTSPRFGGDASDVTATGSISVSGRHAHLGMGLLDADVGPGRRRGSLSPTAELTSRRAAVVSNVRAPSKKQMSMGCARCVRARPWWRHRDGVTNGHGVIRGDTGIETLMGRSSAENTVRRVDRGVVSYGNTSPPKPPTPDMSHRGWWTQKRQGEPFCVRTAASPQPQWHPSRPMTPCGPRQGRLESEICSSAAADRGPKGYRRRTPLSDGMRATRSVAIVQRTRAPIRLCERRGGAECIRIQLAVPSRLRWHLRARLREQRVSELATGIRGTKNSHLLRCTRWCAARRAKALRPSPRRLGLYR